jgi:acylphosphatase
MIRTVRVVVSGRVQGVGFRSWLERQAAMQGVSGWVRNRWDGSVEALFSGEASAVDAMIGACRAGPRWATVEGVTVVEAAADRELRGFRAIPSA